MSATRILNLSRLGRKITKCGSFRWDHHLALPECAKAIQKLPETRVTELSNGFRVATETTDSPVATVGVWIDAGSRYETNKNNGVANFFQHLVFKGTNQKSLEALENEVQTLGAQINSYVDREETAFYAKCLSSDAPKLADLLGEVITDTKLDDAVIEQERQVVLKELDQVEADLRQVTMDYLHLTAYQGTPLEKSVYGPSENIKNLTKEDVTSYVRDSFVAPRMVLCGSGNINHDELVKAAEKRFGSVPATYAGEIPVLKPCRFTGSDVRVRDDWYPFAHIAMAVETCGMNSPDVYPLMIAKQAVGSWDKTLLTSENTSNSLVTNIYKEPRCHSFESFHKIYRDCSLWGCYFVMDKMILDDFIFNLMNEWIKLCINVTEDELVLAKSMLLNNLLLGLDDSTNVCADIGRQLLFLGKRVPFEEVEEKIHAITLNKLRDTCMKYIYDRCLAASAVGPIEGFPDYTRLRSQMYRLRF